MVAHVGDSRLYRLRDDEVLLITEDHSLYNAMLKAGNIPDESDPRMSHIRNAVTRAVGVRDHVDVDTFDIELDPGDRYLLCSDGLHGYWEGVESNPLDFMSEGDLAVAIENMIDFANHRGGKDNITAILIELPPEDSFDQTMGGTRNEEALRRAAFAKGLNTRERRLLASRLTEQELQPGEVLTADETPADGLWLIAEGELELVSTAGSRRNLRPGDIVGETALFSGANHSSRITAASGIPVRLLYLSRQEIRRLTTEDPGLLARVMTNIAVRQSGRLVAASQTIGDPVWRYGFPETKTRGSGPARTKSVTTAELNALTEDDLKEVDEPAQTPRRDIDAGGDTLPNIPLASITPPPSPVDVESLAPTVGHSFGRAMAELAEEQNAEGLAQTADMPKAHRDES